MTLNRPARIVPDDADPFDPLYYEAYSEWLMRNYMICNGDDLVRHLERGEGFEQFLIERNGSQK